MISAIVAVDTNWGIGFNGELLETIPEDLKRFKELTTGNTVVMGRKTWDSLPKKPLPDRCNIIISRQGEHYEKNDGYNPSWTMPLEKCITVILNDDIDDYFIIGGGQIYKELLPYCDKVYLTRIYKKHDNIDTYFPNLDEMKNWKIEEQSPIRISNNIPYSFVNYVRI